MTTTPEMLQGTIERVTFHSEASGFCVLRVQVQAQHEPMTLIGRAVAISAGEYIEAQGEWVNDKQHGLQFRAETLRIVPPKTLEGIEKYLSSGMVRGIGTHFAKKLVKAFGEEIFEVIEKAPERLLVLKGIGQKRTNMIAASWAEQRTVRDIMVFLHSHGIGTARAVRIYKTYGNEAIQEIEKNPYRLALDIRGIGFQTADRLAQKLGIEKNALIRAQAGVRHVLNSHCERGHCAVVQKKLIEMGVELLEIEESIVIRAIEHEVAEKRLIVDEIDQACCIYPKNLYYAEWHAAQYLAQLHQGTPPWGDLDLEKAIPWVEDYTHLTLSDSQREAIKTVLSHKLSIITGGPGVGKTTLVNSLLKIIRAKHLSIALCAPTGRAARRLTETTGLTAKTIHRLLEFDPISYSFRHDQNHPLPIEVLVIDESSMIDITLLTHLLKAIPTKSAVIWVGDIDQLPSVGAGAVLSDLIRSGVVATVRLTEVFRQAADSQIITNAHRMNQGEMPLGNVGQGSDFFTIYSESAEDIHEKLLSNVCERLPRYYTCDPIRDIQVLSPMNRGGLGCFGLNVDLQARLNPWSEPKIKRHGVTYAPGDKVIQTINNYNKEVFNGDIGFIKRINETENVLKIAFDHRIVDYHYTELDELSLAYAISIHKSQGSEFPIVVLPMAMQHYALLACNLLYTGVTRGKRLVLLIGQKKAIGMAVRNRREAQRLTKLATRLQEETAC